MAPFSVDHESAVTVWGQVRGDLRRRLEAGDFRPGTRIPSEADLAQQYRVSRVTVRRAIAALTAEGYLTRRSGSGTFVTARAGAPVHDIDLTRPWREQIIAAGHEARTSVLRDEDDVALAPDVVRAFIGRVPDRPLRFALSTHSVDGVVVGCTESWRTDEWSALAPDGSPAYAGIGAEIVFAECFTSIGSASSEEAQLLDADAGAPVFVVLARTTMATTGMLAEFARTVWLGTRVRQSYRRRYSLADVDIAQATRRGTIGSPQRTD